MSYPISNLEDIKSAMSSLLGETPDHALLPTAKFYERLARFLRDKHARLEADAARRKSIARDLGRLRHQLGPWIYDQVAAGADLDRLAADLERTGTPTETTFYYYRTEEKKRKKQVKAERDIEIMRFVARGWTNAALADRFGVSERNGFTNYCQAAP